MEKVNEMKYKKATMNTSAGRRAILNGLPVVPVVRHEIRQEKPRLRRSKHYEIRICYEIYDENGDYEDSELLDIMEVADFKKYTLSGLLESLEKNQHLILQLSERFYERHFSDEQWEFIDDDLHSWYSEGEGFDDMSQSGLPKNIVKQLNNWEKKGE